MDWNRDRRRNRRRDPETGLAVVRLAVAGLAVLLAPVTVTALAGYALAWWRGWPPRRLYLAAAGCAPLAGGWLATAAFGPARLPGPRPGQWWLRLLVASCRGWLAMYTAGAHGHVVVAALVLAPLAIPAGLAAGGLAWARRRFRMAAGTGGLHPGSPARFDLRLWAREARTARGAASSTVRPLPLLLPNDCVVAGATIRSVGHPARRVAAIPFERLRSHQVVIGSTGTGKTTLLLRLWAAFMAGGVARHAAGSARRPLLVVLDCKGGASSRQVAARARQVLGEAGAARVATWPQAPLSLWTLPPGQLVTTLLDLIEHGTGGAAYYTDVMESLVALAVGAPPGPPASSAQFLARLDADWLAAAYTSAGNSAGAAAARSGKKAIDDVALRFRALWRRLGPGLDGGGSFADADAWYCTLEGTAEPAVAEAQARALTDLLAAYAMTSQREILLSVDEFSSVARRLPIWRLYERARSLGLAVQVTAQSWEGLGADDDERYRVAATAEGGIWLLRTPRPEPVAELAGTRTVVQTTRYLSGRHTWEPSGVSTQREVPVINPDLIRRLDVGQAAYLYRGGVTYLHVKPPAQPAPASEDLFTRIRATPALPWAPPRPALPRAIPRRGPAPALPPGRTDHERPESAITQPLPQIQPAAGEPTAFTRAFGDSQT
jgi:TraM recognition site of TraD and TraG